MCFSASASFSAGAILTVIGVAAIKKVQHPSQLMFAGIPLIFAIQQMAEGVLWLTLPYAKYAHTQFLVTYIFLFFAEVLWPLWVPLAILFLEKDIFRKKIQIVLVAAGILVSLYLAFCLFTYPVRANIIGYHISYTLLFPPALQTTGIVLYAMATILPPFFSPLKRMWMLGLAILISYIISAIFYEHYILSVWCFFASVISISVYAIIVKIKNESAKISLSAASMHVCRA
jgi:hypothetical protein